MSPEEKARQIIDEKLRQAGWVIQDTKQMNISASLGVAVREFPTSTGEVDYALFVNGVPVGVIEAKREEKGEDITSVEQQSARYANSTLKWITGNYRIRFAYESTGRLTRFTDYNDIKYRSRDVFSFHRPETLQRLLQEKNTIRNNLKQPIPFDSTGFRACQIRAIENLDKSFAENKSRALIQMATGAGKTFTAITAAYRLLKYGNMNRILFLVDTKSLGEQAECEFLAYMPNDDPRPFSSIYGVHRLKTSRMPPDTNIYISTQSSKEKNWTKVPRKRPLQSIRPQTERHRKRSYITRNIRLSSLTVSLWMSATVPFIMYGSRCSTILIHCRADRYAG